MHGISLHVCLVWHLVSGVDTRSCIDKRIKTVAIVRKLLLFGGKTTFVVYLIKLNSPFAEDQND